MKHFRLFSLLLAGMLALAACTPATTAPPTTVPTTAAGALPDLGGREVTIAVENAYIPFNYVRLDNGVAEGWDYDALGEACKRLNCKPVFKEFGWDTMITAVSQGQFDMAADGITITPERAQVVDFSDPYIQVDQRVMVRLDETRFTTLDELKAGNYKLGSQKGTTNYDEAVKMGGEDHVVGFDSFGDVVQALISGDIDAAFIDDTAGQGYVGVNKDKIQAARRHAHQPGAGLGLSPRARSWWPPFNAALNSMRDDGTLETLRLKWFPQSGEVIDYDSVGPGAYGDPTATPSP